MYPGRKAVVAGRSVADSAGMESDSRWRRALAERYAAAYRDLPGVRAVLLTGSVARGLADRYSDVELMVFWSEPPAAPPRRKAAEAGGGAVTTLHGYDEENDEWADDVLVSGVEVQVSHRTVAGTERWLADVTTRFAPDLVKQDLIALIRHAVPLHGADLVRTWQRRAAGYPPELALAMIRAHLDFRSSWQRHKLLDRGELLPLYADLVETVRNVVLVLLGLNRVYFPHLGFKWLPALAGELAIAPEDLAARLDAVFTAPPAEAARTADALVEQTLELVHAHLPEAGAAEELARFRQRRPVWDSPPASSRPRG